jgi:hypothetical protein
MPARVKQDFRRALPHACATVSRSTWITFFVAAGTILQTGLLLALFIAGGGPPISKNKQHGIHIPHSGYWERELAISTRAPTQCRTVSFH